MGDRMSNPQDIWAVALKEKGLENDYKDCFGCGPENLKGLQIKSFWDGKQAICRWKAEPHHNGAKGILNGGIIASLIDCHSFWTALAATYHNERRQFGDGKPIKMVTASISVRYIHPIMIDSEVELKAHLAKVGNRSKVVLCSVYADGKECAQGEVTLVHLF